MRCLVLVLALFIFALVGCKDKTASPSPAGNREKAAEAPATIPVPQRLLHASLRPTLVELPTDALPLWQQFASAKPILVLLSQDPLLAPLPNQLQEEALTLLREGSRKGIEAGVNTFGTDPLLTPSMTLSAALEAGYFSRAVWVLPTSGATDELSVDTFRAQLRQLGAIDDQEALSFTRTAEGVFSGIVRGIPFQAVHPDAVPALNEPVVLHIDLSYFQPLYKGEIKTPLYPLLAQTLDRLRKKEWQAYAVTISLSNLGQRVPLASRFTGRDLADFFQQPAILDQPLPERWDLRGRALYLENFFKKDEVRDLYLAMEQKDPTDPSVKYALYQVAREFKEGDKAIDYLAQAVSFDRIYGLEYLSLADVAKKKQLPDQVLRMLFLAQKTFPDDPMLKIPLAEQLLSSGQKDEAHKLLDELQSLSWSPIFYPDMNEYLASLKQR